MPPPLQILCFGDSLTQGYHGYGVFASPYSKKLEEKLRGAFPGREIDVVTSGVPGDRDAISRQRRVEHVVNHGLILREGTASRTRFTWTIVLGGTKQVTNQVTLFRGQKKTANKDFPTASDIGFGFTPERVFSGLEKAWQIPLESGSKVLALTVPECSAKSERLDIKRNELNKRILEYKARNYYAFDLKPKIPYHSLSPEDQERYWDDGLHLTMEGYEWMGGFIADELIRMIREESAPVVNPSVANGRP